MRLRPNERELVRVAYLTKKVECVCHIGSSGLPAFALIKREIEAIDRTLVRIPIFLAYYETGIIGIGDVTASALPRITTNGREVDLLIEPLAPGGGSRIVQYKVLFSFEEPGPRHCKIDAGPHGLANVHLELRFDPSIPSERLPVRILRAMWYENGIIVPGTNIALPKGCIRKDAERGLIATLNITNVPGRQMVGLRWEDPQPPH